MYPKKTQIVNFVKENALVAKADKGKTGVIIYTDEYKKKIPQLPSREQFQKLQNDPTDKYQKLITKDSAT